MMDNPDPIDPGAEPTRRDFGKSLALLATASLAGASPAAQQPKPADVQAGVAKALTEIVRLRHGQHLDQKQMEAIQQRLALGQLVADRMRQSKVQLTNADEPSFLTRADLP